MQKSKIASLIATGALLLSTATPAFAETIEISGNGATSVNTANVAEVNTTTVTQNNTAAVSNNVSSNANSGGNSANFNTGGDVNVVSGAATSNVEVTNAVNSNQAQVAPCGNCAGGAGSVKISGNGATSHNTANLTDVNATVLGQTNNAAVANNVASNANSGDNAAGFNTGGNTTVVSGPATSDAKVTTAANVNTAQIGGSVAVLPGAGTTSALISGNGAGSVNNVNLALTSSAVLAQANNAMISNSVASNANSGGNAADFNTGGTVIVASGLAKSMVDVDNLANFNAADLSCDCLTSGVTAKIAGNGAGLGGFNTINATLANALGLSQGNLAALGNDVAGNANSGTNAAGFNVGAVANDPAVVSNGSVSTTSVSNLSNWNGAGAGATVALPGGSSLNLLMDFSSLLMFLNMM